MFSGSFERLLSAARAKDVNADRITPLSNALQNETDAYFKTLQAGAAGAGRQQNPGMTIGAGFTPALDLDGNPIPGTSTGIPVSNKSIPGMDIGNMQGLVTGGVQTNQAFPVVTGGVQTNQVFPIIKQQIPAMTLDGGKTYFDPRDGSPINMNSLQPKDFFLTPGY
tara:strand:- start:13 stop:510 length:498 start_codon:yes stop_codon:yes gene_type:complete